MTMLSVAGMYAWDDQIFSALHIPSDLDIDTQVADILVECSELELLIPDPDVFKQSLNYWSMQQLPIWERLYRTTQLEYNPIWNKDGTITETRTLEREDLETRNLANSATTQATGQVSAFNSSAFQNADKQNMTGSGTDTGTVNKAGTDEETITRREIGNIGVTTTQQMLKEERDISTFNIYRYITESFKSMYCIGVY